MQIDIIYWSGTGNTEDMAKLIQSGAAAAGATTTLTEVDAADAEAALDAEVLALGCPSMGDEVLEEDSFEPFIAAIEGSLAGKKLALFGSYGWGDGQWMRDWAQRMEAAGAVLVCAPLIVNEAPRGEAEAHCAAFGKGLVV